MTYPYQINSLEQYHNDYKKSVDYPEGFWGSIAENFLWRKKWDKVLNWNFKDPKIEWFAGGKLNITENCIDRHLATKGDEPAIIWEPNNPDERTRTVTYNRLHKRVCQFAQVLRNNGVKKGDRICIYMGMVPELAYAMLGCARIGAIHSVIFGGFSAQSIADRLEDAQAEFIVTCDGVYRGEKIIPLKAVIDDALIGNKVVKKVIVYTRTRTPVSMLKGRDLWWEDEMEFAEAQLGEPPEEKNKFENFQAGEVLPSGVDLGGAVVTRAAEEMDAEDPLFILYTSGSTGKPKGVVHTVAGYMVWTNYTFINVFNYKPGQIHFCTADIGWVTGHSYILYGPLSAGATSLMFEGIPTFPDAGRLWDIVEKHRVNILYTAPTAIRSLMGYGLKPLEGKDLSSLQILGTVGEPINEEAWHWYDENIGHKKCPIVDTWWQTETGGTLISNLAGITPAKPSWATLPMPGVQPLLVDENGKEVTEKDENGVLKGNLCIKAPWPGILRTTWGDHERCRVNYFATYDDLYFTGDGALKDSDGNYRITGRVDDVLNISGHRIGTAEVENAINMHAGVVESAVVGYPHDIKGQGIYAYVIYNGSHAADEKLTRLDIAATVARVIGAIAKPDKIQFVTGLPKTRSGKIMRRILRKIAEGEVSNLGDTSTLLDPGVVDEIKNGKV
ncbi:MAG: acetate--CoA ligase [Ferruginibacter sp.]